MRMELPGEQKQPYGLPSKINEEEGLYSGIPLPKQDPPIHKGDSCFCTGACAKTGKCPNLKEKPDFKELPKIGLKELPEIDRHIPRFFDFFNGYNSLVPQPYIPGMTQNPTGPQPYMVPETPNTQQYQHIIN